MAEQARGVVLHLFAAARAAAGTDRLDVPAGTLEEVLTAAVARAPGLAEVLPRCSILVDGAVAHGRDDAVDAGARIDVLPPFAGG